MSKEKVKYYLDFIPLVILIISAVVLIFKVCTSDHVFVWKHFIGFVFLATEIFIIIKNHKIGVLFLGLMLLVGIFGLLSFDIEIETSTIAFTELEIPIFYGQPIYFLWFLIHFIISFRYYVGILGKKYWSEIFQSN